MKENKLMIQDLISIGVFTAIYFVLVTIATFATSAIIPGLSYVLIPALNKAMILLSYIVFSYGLMGPVLPIWFLKDQYVSNLVARGKDAVYIERLFEYILQNYVY